MRRYATFAFSFFAQLIANQSIFAMYQYRLVHLSQFLRAFVKLPVINVAKIIIDATIAAGGDKALEADNAHFVQLMQPIQL